MAVEQQLKVTFIGEDGNLTKTLSQLEGQLSRFEKAAKDAGGSGDSFNRLNRAIEATKQRMDALRKSASNVIPTGLKTGTADATQALSNLSRVAQDAPFGFIGIANNLNPLLESFQRLKKESGSTSGALKSLVSGMTGAGGLGLALGVVSAAITLFSMGFGAWTRGFKDSKKSIEENKNALQDYVKGLEELTQVRLAGAQSAQDELVKLKTLYDATQNANIPLAKRRELVDELQAQYPKYFKNISDETILAGGATEAYKKLSGAILSAAKARAAQDTLVDIQKQILVQDEKINDATEKEIKSQQELARTRKQVKDQPAGGVQGASDAAGFQAINLNTKLSESEAKYKDAIKETSSAVFEKSKMQERANRIAEEASKIIETNPDALLNPKSQLPKVVKEKELKVEYDRITVAKITDIGMEGGTGRMFENLNKQIAEALKPTELEKYVTNLWKGKQIALPIAIAPKPIIDPAPLTQGINDMISKALQGIAVEGFSRVGEAIGNALTTGGIGDAFKGFGEFLGNAIQNIGKQMIAMAPLIQAIQVAIRSFNPALLLPAGIALTALGGVIKNMFASALPGHKSGLDSVPYDDYVARLHKGEMVLTAPEAKQYRAMESPKQKNPFSMFAMPEMPSMQPIVLETRIRNRDIRIGQFREGKSQLRRTGR